MEIAHDILLSLELKPEYLDFRDAKDSYLAFVNSHLAPCEQLNDFIEETLTRIKATQKLGTGYCLLFLGMAYRRLGRNDAALAVFREVILHCEKFNYLANKAIASSYIGEIYAERKEFELAVQHQSEAIKLFIQEGSKGDLAKTRYQIGLTYQAMNEFDKSNEHFQQAILLFAEMKAPKQVERVRRSMNI